MNEVYPEVVYRGEASAGDGRFGTDMRVAIEAIALA